MGLPEKILYFAWRKFFGLIFNNKCKNIIKIPIPIRKLNQKKKTHQKHKPMECPYLRQSWTLLGANSSF
jgi:hypothetical protein